MSDEMKVEVGSGNLWADLGYPDADEMFERCQMMARIIDIIRERKLTQAKAAKLLGTTQPTVSDLMRGKLQLFSLERLISFLRALGDEVELVIKPGARGTDKPAQATG
jgi:predicted XRE-type DNA-binding protein